MSQVIRRVWAQVVVSLLALVGCLAQAAPVLITVDTTQLAGTTGQLAFDLIDGGAPANAVTLQSFGGNATFGSSVSTGGVAGNITGVVTLNDAAFFNEYLQNITFGTTLSFVFDTTGNTGVGFAPDSFSFFVLDSSGTPLGTTTDPTGANSLFLLNIGDPQGLRLFESTAVVLTAQALPPTGVAEPGALILAVTALMALVVSSRRRSAKLLRQAGLVLGFAFAVTPVAWSSDLTSQVALTKSGFVLNRTTNTFDSIVTVRNLATDPMVGPMRITLETSFPAAVALYNSSGRNQADRDYVLLPLPGGVLAPGASASVPIKLINTGRAVISAEFSVQGALLTPATSSTLKVNAFFADGPNGTLKGQPVGAGFTVTVDGYVRGQTDAAGSLVITVPTTSKRVGVRQVPNAAGTTTIGAMLPTQVKTVDVLVGDGGEVYGDGVLRIDQVQQLLLARNAPRISMRFTRDEKPLRLATLAFAQVSNVVGSITDVTSLFSLQTDGSLAASGPALYQALSGLSGRAEMTVDGEDTDGTPVRGTAVFHLVDYRTRVQLVAPPSRPNLSLAGISVKVRILNTNIVLRAESDATGFIILPDLPSGSISLESSTSSNGVGYSGVGTGLLNKNSLVRLTMRASADILNGVPAIAIEPLPPGTAAVKTGVPTAASVERPIYTERQLAERLAYGQTKALPQAVSKSLRELAAATPLAVSVAVTAGVQNAQIEQSAELAIPKGTKKLVLTYTVQTDEYPFYVQAQSIFNDFWSMSVLEPNGTALFSIARQINSQLTQEPVWLADGTTGQIKKELDVTGLAANAAVNVILRATAVNIGDSALPTRVTAKLDAGPQLIIGTITPDEVDALNDGSFYSIPRPGATNTNQRVFTVDVSKPEGSTLSAVGVELRTSAGANLMQVLADTSPGDDGVEVVTQDDTSAKLKVRVTLGPSSTINGTPPPTRDLTYRIKVKGTDSTGAAISDQKDVTGKRSLWRMPDGIARYGSRDPGGDDWAARGTYTWLSANSALIRPINDISGEHGINLQHQTHARGTDIDMFHFYLFPGVGTGPGQGLVNFNKLRADVIESFATLGQNPPMEATAAKARVAAWISASRTGLTNLAANAAVASVIYCSGPASQGLPAGWCKALLTTGKATRTTTTGNNPPVTETVDFGNGSYTNNKMANNNVHNDHIHVTLTPGQIGE